MAHTDPIADFLNRLKNASQRRIEVVQLPSSKIKLEIARILKANGYIADYEYAEKDQKTLLTVTLQYFDRLPAIRDFKRISTPGQRLYSNVESLQKGSRRNQTVIVSTSKGLMTTKDAKAQKLGGELICQLW